MGTVVVTGAKGFIGREVVRQCREKGFKVISVDVVDSDEQDYVRMDITGSDLERCIPPSCEAVIHLAGYARAGDCKNNLAQVLKTNVISAVDLLQAAKKKQAQQFIFASSEWVYGECANHDVKDETAVIDVLALDTEYALSKAVAEAALKVEFKNGSCPITILRFGIVYGPKVANFGAVEALFDTISQGKAVTIGSLRTGRRYIHVSDVAAGIVAAIGLPGYTTLNLTGDALITLHDVITTSERILNKKVAHTETSPEEFNIRNITNEKAKKLMNWKPRYSLEEGLRSLKR